MKKLTEAEEEVMQILWKTKKAFVKEILEYFDNPKPAYNTVSTIIRILEKKGFVKHEAFGKSHMYSPIVTKENYRKYITQTLFKNYFDNSFNKLVSHFAESENLDEKEIEELDELLKKMKK